MTLGDRRRAYMQAFPKWAASWPHVVREVGDRDVLYATWMIGNDYRNATRFYGAYPPGYLARVMALFPDIVALGRDSAILHVFSGSLPPGPYERCDLVQPADIQANVYDLPNIVLNHRPRLIIADPPYTSDDAKRYQTPMVNRGRVFRSLAHVVEPGGFVAWLDTVWPMHRKAEWTTVGRITVLRSTNHRVRLLSIFQRTAQPVRQIIDGTSLRSEHADPIGVAP